MVFEAQFFGYFSIVTILLDNNLGYISTQHLVGIPRLALGSILSHSENFKISGPHLLKIDLTNFQMTTSSQESL